MQPKLRTTYKTMLFNIKFTCMDIENVLDFYLGKNIEDKFTQEFIFLTPCIQNHDNLQTQKLFTD